MKIEKCWDLMHYCMLMHSGIPHIFYNSTDAYATRQRNDHYVYHNGVVTVAIPNGCRHHQLPKNARSTKKGPRRCANWLVGPYLNVWIVYRKIKYTSKLSLGYPSQKIYTVVIAFIKLYMFAFNPNNEVTYCVFLKYSGHVLLLF